MDRVGADRNQRDRWRSAHLLSCVRDGSGLRVRSIVEKRARVILHESTDQSRRFPRSARCSRIERRGDAGLDAVVGHLARLFFGQAIRRSAYTLSEGAEAPAKRTKCDASARLQRPMSCSYAPASENNGSFLVLDRPPGWCPRSSARSEQRRPLKTNTRSRPAASLCRERRPCRGRTAGWRRAADGRPHSLSGRSPRSAC